VNPESPAIEPRHALEEMLKHLGFAVTVTERPLDEQILLDIQTDDPGRLIGRAGQTLSDLQYLLNRLAFKSDSRIPRIVLDVGGYRQQARDLLTSRAKEAAEKVRRRGEIMELEPLNAYDRYIVHQALKDDPDVETHSVEVDGSDKKVILIRPKRR
jgi:spoIIIJ-associated protein